MRTNTRRRLLASLLAIATVGAGALIATPAAYADTTVSTYDDLASAFASATSAASTISLDGPVSSTGSTLTLANGATATLDLDGSDLSLAGIVLGTGSTLTITDSTTAGGTLTVTGGTNGTGIEVDAGETLHVGGSVFVQASPLSDYEGGAGIGTGVPEDFQPSEPSAGTIDIGGYATVHAVGSENGAAIGGATAEMSESGQSGGTISISGHAVVTASTPSGYAVAAAIGGGGESGGQDLGTSITIGGSATVDATSHGYGAAIGDGDGTQTAGTIAIGGSSTVTALTTQGSAAIGGAWSSPVSDTITIGGDATVSATGSTYPGYPYYGAGIGASAAGTGAAITISDGAQVTASNGNGAASAVGYGVTNGSSDTTFGSLTLSGGTLTIPPQATLDIPQSTTVENGGTIVVDGTLSGDGSVANAGTIVNSGTVSVSAVTGHDYALSFDASPGTLTGSSPLQVYADSVDDAQLSLPSATPTDPADGFLGWLAGGTQIAASSSLSAAAGSSGGTAVAVALTADYGPVPIVATGISSGTVGIPFSASVAGDLAPTATYSVTAGTLPAGLHLHASTGAITGTPTAAVTASVAVRALNGAGSASSTIQFVIDPAPVVVVAPPVVAPPVVTHPTPPTATAPSISTRSLPKTTQGFAYSARLDASGTGPLAYSIASGTLPVGLSLGGSTGAITGTPSRSGTTFLAFTVTGPGGAATKSLGIVVAKLEPLKLSAPTAAVVTGGSIVVTAAGLSKGEHYWITLSGRTVASGIATGRTLHRTIHIGGSLASGTRTLVLHGAAHAASALKVATAKHRVVVAAKKHHLTITTLPGGAVQANAQMRISVSGLYAGEHVTVQFRGKVVSQKRAKADKRGRYSIIVTAGWSWGFKPIVVTGSTKTRAGSELIAVISRTSDSGELPN